MRVQPGHLHGAADDGDQGDDRHEEGPEVVGPAPAAATERAHAREREPRGRRQEQGHAHHEGRDQPGPVVARQVLWRSHHRLSYDTFENHKRRLFKSGSDSLKDLHVHRTNALQRS